MSKAYYNEIDPYAAEWLRTLIFYGHIAEGDVDERSIEDVRPDELAGYTQCHFFAGIGVWSLALRGAGWPDDEPVWTGSCPCQPFSAAGKQKGTDDARHLWPAWFRLIRERKPGVIFGEQVEQAIRHGWLDLVSTDLESEGYAIGSAVVGAHSVGAPHLRKRLYFVADIDDAGSQGRRSTERSSVRAHGQVSAYGSTGFVEDAELPEEARFRQLGGSRIRQQEAERLTGPSGRRGWWGNADWLYCTDQKYRPVEPGTFPLVNGAPARVGRLRAYGNAIVAPLAQEFIAAYRDVRGLA